jgi:hypothetical protein
MLPSNRLRALRFNSVLRPATDPIRPVGLPQRRRPVSSPCPRSAIPLQTATRFVGPHGRIGRVDGVSLRIGRRTPPARSTGSSGPAGSAALRVAVPKADRTVQSRDAGRVPVDRRPVERPRPDRLARLAAPEAVGAGLLVCRTKRRASIDESARDVALQLPASLASLAHVGTGRDLLDRVLGRVERQSNDSARR